MAGPAAAWGTSEYLLAAVVDLLAYSNYLTLRANGVKSARKPKPLPRPGESPKGERFGSQAVSIDEMRRRLDEWHGREG